MFLKTVTITEMRSILFENQIRVCMDTVVCCIVISLNRCTSCVVEGLI